LQSLLIPPTKELRLSRSYQPWGRFCGELHHLSININKLVQMDQAKKPSLKRRQVLLELQIALIKELQGMFEKL